MRANRLFDELSGFYLRGSRGRIDRIGGTGVVISIQANGTT
ncbi:MAG: hypothetical protein ABIW36_02780 [Terrimesophilobacter sp.]